MQSQAQHHDQHSSFSKELQIVFNSETNTKNTRYRKKKYEGREENVHENVSMLDYV